MQYFDTVLPTSIIAKSGKYSQNISIQRYVSEERNCNKDMTNHMGFKQMELTPQNLIFQIEIASVTDKIAINKY